MSTESEYFDSQASAAAILEISIDVIRQAKREGCQAFRSGRVYRRELLAWLAARRKAPEIAAADDAGVDEWFDREEKIHGLMFAIEKAYHAGSIPIGEYVRLAEASMPHVIALAKLWAIEFDAAAFRKCWRETLGAATAANAFVVENWRQPKAKRRNAQ